MRQQERHRGHGPLEQRVCVTSGTQRAQVGVHPRRPRRDEDRSTSEVELERRAAVVRATKRGPRIELRRVRAPDRSTQEPHQGSERLASLEHLAARPEQPEPLGRTRQRRAPIVGREDDDAVGERAREPRPEATAAVENEAPAQRLPRAVARIADVEERAEPARTYGKKESDEIGMSTHRPRGLADGVRSTEELEAESSEHVASRWARRTVPSVGRRARPPSPWCHELGPERNGPIG